LLVMADGKANAFEGTFAEWSETQREAESAAAATRSREKTTPAPKPEPVKSQGPKRRNPAAPVVDMEQLIIDLENRLKEIEVELLEATVNQNFEEMTRLGDEHVQAQEKLEKNLEEWDSE
jgi:hypothetical protein